MAVARSNHNSQPPAPGGNNSGTGGHAHSSGGSRKLSFVVSPQLDNRREVQQQILDLAQQLGFTGEIFFAINLALEEALTNAIKHGNRLDPSKKVKVEAKISAKRFEVRIEDEGPGFDRKCVPDPTVEQNIDKCSGRGILLIEAYMDSVSWDRGGRRVKLVKHKEPKSD